MRPAYNRLSLIKPKIDADVAGPIKNIGRVQKMKRDTFESLHGETLPEIYQGLDYMQNNNQVVSEPDPYMIKIDKRLEYKSKQLKEVLRARSEKLLKYKEITENIEFFIELDEKIIDLDNIKDHSSSSTDEYELCNNEFLHAKFIEFPRRLTDAFKTQEGNISHCTTAVFPEANIVVVTVNNQLLIWRYSCIMSTNDIRYDAALEFLHKVSHLAEDQNLITQDYKTIITAVGVGKPRPFVFVSQDIQFLLVVATYDHVHIYSLELSQNQIKLKPTEFNTPTEDIIINKINFSQDGRIFATQNDGKLIELNYEKSSSLFGLVQNTDLKKITGKKRTKLSTVVDTIKDIISIPGLFKKDQFICKKITIDETRHILYALNENSKIDNEFIIQVYDLGPTGMEFQHCFDIQSHHLKKNLLYLGRKIEDKDLDGLRIASIVAIDRYYSEDLHILLVTNFGIRIYIELKTKTLSENERMSFQTKENMKYIFDPRRPDNGYIIKFIKLPIVQSLETLDTQLRQFPLQRVKLTSAIVSTRFLLQHACQSKSTLVLSVGDALRPSDNNEGSNVGNGIFAFTTNLSFQAMHKIYENILKKPIPECVSLIQMPSDHLIDAIELKKDSLIMNDRISKLLGYQLPGCFLGQKLIGGKTGHLHYACLNELAKQTYFPPSQFLVLNEIGLHTIIKFRPIDILYQILMIDLIRTGDESEFINFLEKYGLLETCAMLVQIICHSQGKYYSNYLIEDKIRTDIQKSPKLEIISQRIPVRAPQIGENNIRIYEATPEIKNLAIQYFFKHGETLILSDYSDFQQREDYDKYGRLVKPEKKRFTGKLEGIQTYFSRIIRPIWNCNIMNSLVYLGKIEGSLEMFSEDQLKLVKGRIVELRDFIKIKSEKMLSKSIIDKSNSGMLSFNELAPFAIGANINNNLKTSINPYDKKSELFKANPRNSNIDDLLFEDQKTMDNLYEFLEKVIQSLDVLSFMLSDKTIIQAMLFRLKDIERQTFLNFKFHDIFRDGESESVVKAMLNNYLLYYTGQDFSEKASLFHERFPYFFTKNDLEICRAEKLLLRACLQSISDRNKDITHAINILRDKAEYISRERIDELFELFIENNIITDFVRVLIDKIKALNTLYMKIKNEEYTKSQFSKEIISTSESELINEATYCREQIIKILQEIQLSLMKSSKFVESIFDKYPAEIKKKIKYEIIEEITNFDEEFMHISLIKWMLRENLVEDLLDLKSKYVEAVLSKDTEQFENKENILLNYFIKTFQYEKAFRLAFKMATIDQTEEILTQDDIPRYKIPDDKVLRINKRIELMKCGASCLQKMIDDSATTEETKEAAIRNLRNLNLSIDLAEIQNKCYLRYFYLASAIQNAPLERILVYQNNLNVLNRRIYELNELLDMFIYPDQLYEAQIYTFLFLQNVKQSQQDITITYEKFIRQVYEENDKNWPTTIKDKLLEIHSCFKGRDENLFPLIDIIDIIERINNSHKPFKEAFEELAYTSKYELSFNFIENGHFWAIYFFFDKLDYSFSSLLNVYKTLYREKNIKNLDDEISYTASLFKYHYSNCILFLINLWFMTYEKKHEDLLLVDKHQKSIILNNEHKCMINDLIDDINSFVTQLAEKKTEDKYYVEYTFNWSNKLKKKLEDIAIKQLNDSSYLSMNSLNQTSFYSMKSKKSGMD